MLLIRDHRSRAARPLAFVGEHQGGDERATAAAAPPLEQFLGSIGRRQAR